MKNIITYDELISFFKKYNFNIPEDQMSNIEINDNWFYSNNIELFKKEIEVSLKTNYKYSNYIYNPAIFNYSDLNNINLRIANIIISPKTMNIDNNINNILFLNKTIDASYYHQTPSFVIFYLFIKYISTIKNKDIKSILDNLILSNISSIEKYLNSSIYKKLTSDFHISDSILNNKYFESGSKFIKFISKRILYSNNINEEINQWDKILSNIDNNINAYPPSSLKIIGDKYLNNNSIKIGLSNKNIFNSYTSLFFENNPFYLYEIESVKILLKIIVGYLIKNKPKTLSKIEYDFINNYDLKTSDDQNTKEYKIMFKNDTLLRKIITEDLDIIDIENYNIPKYLMLDFNNIIQDNEQKNKEVIFKKASEYIDNIFKNRIQQFLEKYYNNKYSNDNLKILIESIKRRIRICRVICFICENENILNNESKIDKYIYKIIFKNEMYEGEPIQIIDDCYDEKIISNNIENLFKEYELENSNDIQKIVFADSNLLSRISRLKFKSLEQKGDIIYRMIITDLILEYKIKYIENFHEYYLSFKFQKNICEILKISEYIQSNNLHFGDEDFYADADYFEALLYEIYRTNDYVKTKNFIYKILCKIQSIKTDNDILEMSVQHYNWTNKLTKSLNFNISKLSVYFDGLDHKGVCYKLVNSFVRDYCLLKTVDSKENTSMRYRLIEINEIILPSKMENNALMMSLYNLFHNDFDEFDKNINTIIYND